MAIPRWTVDYFKRGLDGVAEQISHPDTLQRFRESAVEMLGDLPDSAARRLDRMLGQAKSSVAQAREWAKHRVALQTPAINASGILIDPAVASQPLADTAIAAVIEYSTNFSAHHAGAQQRFQRQLRRGVSAAGCPLGSATDIALANSLESALMAIAAWARAHHRPLIIPRCAAIGLSQGFALPEIVAASGASVREVGSNQPMSGEDWKRADLEEDAIILLAGPATAEYLPSERAGRTVVRLLTIAALGESPSPIAPAVPTVCEVFEKGSVDLVILPGDGLTGGPPCGVLVGRQHDVAAITASPGWTSVAAAPLTQMMLAAALTASAEGHSPVKDLLATSVENLQHRADRLKMRIDGGEAAIESEISDQLASLAPDQPYRVPSRQLRLRRDDLPAAQWAAELAGRFPAVLVASEDDWLVIDLRWVRPSEDAALGDALLGRAEEPSAAAEATGG